MEDVEIQQHLQTARDINTPFEFCDMMIEILQQYTDKRFICSFLTDEDKILITRYIIWRSRKEPSNDDMETYIRNNIDVLFSIFSTYNREYSEGCWIFTFIICIYYMDQSRLKELNFFFLQSTGGLLIMLLDALDRDPLYERFYNIADCKVMHFLNETVKAEYLRVYGNAINYVYPAMIEDR